MTNETATLTLEAIKYLRDWSAGLIVLQTGLIGFVGTMMTKHAGNATRAPRVLGAVAVIAMLASIVAGIELYAVLPTLVESATSLRASQIYDQPSNIAHLFDAAVPTVRAIAAVQGTLFVLGVGLLAWFTFRLSVRSSE